MEVGSNWVKMRFVRDFREIETNAFERCEAAARKKKIDEKNSPNIEEAYSLHYGTIALQWRIDGFSRVCQA